MTLKTASKIQTTDVRAGQENEDNEKTAQQETVIIDRTDTMTIIISNSGQNTTVQRDEHDITNCEESTVMNNDKTDPKTDNQV